MLATSGPSFLGMDGPVSRNSDRGSSCGLSSHSSRTSGNLDYLLDDEEPKSSAGKIFMIRIALALAVGFGYLRWRHEGLSALMSGWQKPSAAAPSSDSSPPASSAGTPSHAPDSASAPSQSAPTASQPAATPSAGPPAPESSSRPANPPNPNAPDAKDPRRPPGRY